MQKSFQSGRDKILDDFFKPMFASSKEYWRATGFFSSRVFELLTQEMGQFLLDGGKIRLITSVRLTESDAEAVRRNIKSLDSVCTEQIDSEILQGFIFEKESAKRLLTILRTGHLEMKLSLPNGGKGMFHDKIGLFFAKGSDKYVAFGGSLNETYEGVVVTKFCPLWRRGDAGHRWSFGSVRSVQAC